MSSTKPLSPDKDLSHPPKPWATQQELERRSHRIFELVRREVEHPYTKRTHEVVVVDAPSWVNVIPITSEGEVILVRQFRHGTQSLTLEIPGGMVDPGESPRNAAQRELREETGFDGPVWSSLGAVEPNPAFQTNKCWTFLVHPVVQEYETKWDGGEVIEVVRAPLLEIPTLIRQGEITHSLVIAAFFAYQQHFQGWALPPH